MSNTCSRCKKEFQITSEKLALHKKFGTEPSGLCFDCEHKHRLSFRNERVLYTRQCNATNKTIVSNIAPDSPYTVYSSEYWHGDNWDAMTYGRDFDFSKTFFEQYRELNLHVPRLPLANLRPENSEYCNMCVDNKNCYLVFGGDYNEDCMYATMSMKCRDCLDIDYTNESELCYIMDNSINCYGCRFVWDSKNCTNCYFSTDCTSCEECIFCSNLVNKKNCIENIQLSRDEYLARKKEILTGRYTQQQANWEKFKQLRSNRIVRYGHIYASENVTGEYIKNSKNCTNCIDVTDSEDISDTIFVDGAKDCFQVDYLGHRSEFCTNSIAVITSYNIKGSYVIDNSADICYSEQCIGSNHLFGCNGLRKKKYCILNKQYSREEYFILRDKIIDHMKKNKEWGKFFPREYTPFAYNEGTCMRHFPLTKEQALAEGYRWKDEDSKDFKPQTCEIPDNIKATPDTITREMLACEKCGKNYKILASELKFYRSQNIPAPHYCHDCRFHERHALRNPFKLYDRTCAKCSTPITTTYSPDRPETVYCESCYLKEVY